MPWKDKEKRKAYQKAWYKANTERIKAQHKAWREANREHIRAYHKAHKTKRNALSKAWRDTHHEKAKAQCKAWHETHPEYNKAWWKANHAKHRGYEHIRRAVKYQTQAEPINEKIVYLRDGWICQICRKRVNKALKHPNPMSPSLDHIIPLSQGGTHTYANVQLVHLTCNLTKHVNILAQGEQLRLC